MHKVTMPKLIAVALPEDRLVNPFSGNISSDVVSKALSLNLNGIVSFDGKWVSSPSPSWDVAKLDVGVYKVTHNLGYTNTALSVSLAVQPGCIEISEHSYIDFTVKITVNQEPQDEGWLFSLTKVIS